MPGLTIGGTEIAPGTRTSVRIPVPRRSTQAETFLPAHVVHGRRPGPRLFVSAALHGDEINGVEIIQRLLRRKSLADLRGVLIAVPVVNVYGFVTQQRYLPDRRDLNRAFPGSPTGSLTARLADLFMREVVQHATHGIDLHTGAIHRRNLPHIRASLDDSETARLARAFGTPVVLNTNVPDGSLRQAVLERGIPMLLYEAGEALRFDELAIRVGLRGVMAVMRALGMLPARRAGSEREPVLARSSTWVRAPDGGILTSVARLGAAVHAGHRVGVISDPLGERLSPVTSHVSGIVIGRTELPLVSEGDALVHVARFEEPASVAEQLAAFHADVASAPGSPGEGAGG